VDGESDLAAILVLGAQDALDDFFGTDVGLDPSNHRPFQPKWNIEALTEQERRLFLAGLEHRFLRGAHPSFRSWRRRWRWCGGGDFGRFDGFADLFLKLFLLCFHARVEVNLHLVEMFLR